MKNLTSTIATITAGLFLAAAATLAAVGISHHRTEEAIAFERARIEHAASVQGQLDHACIDGGVRWACGTRVDTDGSWLLVSVNEPRMFQPKHEAPGDYDAMAAEILRRAPFGTP